MNLQPNRFVVKTDKLSNEEIKFANDMEKVSVKSKLPDNDQPTSSFPTYTIQKPNGVFEREKFIRRYADEDNIVKQNEYQQVHQIVEQADYSLCSYSNDNYRHFFPQTGYLVPCRSLPTREMRHKCDMCGKIFASGDNMKRHMRLIHEGIRSFSCQVCGKSFRTRTSIREHRLTHTNEKPYNCNHCTSSFKQKSSLRKHVIRIHTKQFPHTCYICNKGFLTPGDIEKHDKKHHGDVYLCI